MNTKKIELIDNDIEEAANLIGSKDKFKQLKLIEKVKNAWATKEFDPLSGLMVYKKYQTDYIPAMYGGPSPNPINYDWDDDLKRLVSNLEIHKEDLQKEGSSKQLNPLVTINNTNTNMVTVTLSQTIQELNKTYLTKEELAEIMVMLADLDSLKGKKKDTIWNKAKNILSWLGDKAFDVGIAVLPYIMAALA